MSINKGIPLTYDKYIERKEEIRVHKEKLLQELSLLEGKEGGKRHESEDHGQVEEEGEDEEPRKKRSKRNVESSLTLPLWHMLPVQSFKQTVGAIDLFSRCRKLSTKVKKGVDEAVEEFICAQDKTPLFKKLGDLHQMCTDRITKVILSRRKKGRYRNAKEFRIIRMNNRVLVSMRFKKATSRLRCSDRTTSQEVLQKGLNDLVTFRDMERTLGSTSF